MTHYIYEKPVWPRFKVSEIRRTLNIKLCSRFDSTRIKSIFPKVAMLRYLNNAVLGTYLYTYEEAC